MRTPEPGERVFEALRRPGADTVTRGDLEACLDAAGLRGDDPRLASLHAALAPLGRDEALTRARFLTEVLQPDSLSLVCDAATGGLVVPAFGRFRDRIAGLFQFVAEFEGGAVADYIPQLARVDPGKFAVALCTIDGQRMAFGDARDAYCVQSTCKPVNYAVALELFGPRTVHTHVGQEPSGQRFNELTLNRRGLPHNPMINAGAIMCCSLIKPASALAERFDYVMRVWRALAGGEPCGFDNAVYHSERETADRNFALGYFMRENGAFPEGADMHAALDFYFQCCSITTTCDQMALIAAAFANAGVCPLTGVRIFHPETVKNCLSLMYSCGMYDFSGEFAFTVGLPAKSGVSGAMFVVVPGLGGLAIWSPRVDQHGNSVRGVEFSRRFVDAFPFHNYAQIAGGLAQEDPRRMNPRYAGDEALAAPLCWAAARGDLVELKRLIACGADVNAADYDGRTPLHLAACEGRADAVRLLVEAGARGDLRDRWGVTARQEARRRGGPAARLFTEAFAGSAPRLYGRRRDGHRP